MPHGAKRSFATTHSKPLAALADRDSSASTNTGRRRELSRRFSRRRIDPPARELTSGLRRFEAASAFSTGSVASRLGTAPSDRGGGRLSSHGDVDHLQLGEFGQAFFAQLSANSRILGPAEGHVGQNVEVLIDPDRARLHLRSNAVSGVLV